MKKFILATESNCELPQEFLDEREIELINMEFVINGKTVFNNEITDYKKFYDDMKKGIEFKTTQINIERYCEWFRKLLQKNNEILYLAFSSGLSGSYQSAVIAKGIIEEEQKDAKIIVIDTLCASLGEGLFVYTVNEFANEGKTIEETAEFAKNLIQNISHWFTVDDLNHLHRGGRVSKVSAVLGTMIGIKPVLNMNIEGKLLPREKARGRVASLNSLVQKFEKYADKSREQVVFISHGDALEDAQYVLNKIKENNAIKFSLMNNIGPVIGSHSGPATVALFFYSKDREI